MRVALSDGNSLQPEHYLVIDVEATCDDGGAVSRHQMEIIEIGAVVARADTLVAIAEFQSFVRPVRHPRLTAFCKKLTGITPADVARAPTFPEAVSALESFLATYPGALFCSWGDYDRKQFEQDARYHGVTLPLGAHWNVKRGFLARSGFQGKTVEAALARAGLEFEGTPHRGIDDARNICRLLPYALGRRALP